MAAIAARTRILFEGPQGRRAASDAVAIVAFTVIGVLSHDHGLTLLRVLRDAGPIAGAWAVAALGFGLYRRPSWRSFLPTWAVACVAGVLVRAGILGRDIDGRQASFLVTTLVVSLAFTLGLRLFSQLAATRTPASRHRACSR